MSNLEKIAALVKLEDEVYTNRRAGDWPAAEKDEAQIPENMFGYCHEVQELVAQGKTFVHVSMGSCECGDMNATIEVRPEGLWAISTGSYSWMRYDGPAEDCEVAYGLGSHVQTINDAYFEFIKE